MAIYKGFSTIGKYKKFSLTDRELVIRDLLNIFAIKEGELPGRPEIGSRLWNFIFEPNTLNLEEQIQEELERLISKDSRLILHTVNLMNEKDTHSIIVELNVSIKPNHSPEKLYIRFVQESEMVEVIDYIHTNI